MNDSKILQGDLESLQAWKQDWLMEFNPSKSVRPSISRRKPSPWKPSTSFMTLSYPIHHQSRSCNTARFTCHDYMSTSSIAGMSQKLQRDFLQQRRARSRVLMLHRIRNGLVAIPASVYLQPTVVHTRGFETSYRQIQCYTSMYSQTFFHSAIRLWNSLPVDVCQLPPDSFKAQLNTIQLM